MGEMNTEQRIEGLENKYREIREGQDSLLVQNDCTNKKLDAIYICLKGNEFEKDQGNGHGGGVVKRLSRIEDRTDRIDRYIANTKGRNAAIWGLMGLIGASLIGFVVKAWDKIFS